MFTLRVLQFSFSFFFFFFFGGKTAYKFQMCVIISLPILSVFKFNYFGFGTLTLLHSEQPKITFFEGLWLKKCGLKEILSQYFATESTYRKFCGKMIQIYLP